MCSLRENYIATEANFGELRNSGGANPRSGPCQEGVRIQWVDGGIAKQRFWKEGRHLALHVSVTEWALLEEPPVLNLLKNFPAFYGTQRFITVFPRAFYWSLSWARSIQSTPSHPITLRSILILSTHLHLGLPSGLFPSYFPTNILYAFLVSPIRAT